MFASVMDGIKEEAVGFLFNLEVQVEEDDEPVGEEFEPMRAEVPHAGARVVTPGQDDEEVEEVPASVFEKPGQAGREAPKVRAKGLDRPKQPQNLSYSAPSEQGEAEVATASAAGSDDEFSDVGRNQLCPCGSGKKYKRCHGAPGGPTGLTARVS
jgi:preprotein translocase subunit SecA